MAILRDLRSFAALGIADATLGLAATPVAAGTRPTVSVTADEFSFVLSGSTFYAGKYELSFTNNGVLGHEFVAFKLAEGFENLSIEQLKQAADENNDAVVDNFAGAAGARGG